MKPTKCPAREKLMRQKKRKRGDGRKRKVQCRPEPSEPKYTRNTQERRVNCVRLDASVRLTWRADAWQARLQDAKDLATFAAWSDRDNLLSTCTSRSLSEVVYFMMLLPRRRAWIGQVNVDLCCMIIAIHFSGCGTIEFLSHHTWRSARTLFREFVSKFIVSAIQYIVVSSAYR